MIELHEAFETCVEESGTSGFLSAYRYSFSPALLTQAGADPRMSAFDAAIAGTAFARRLAALASK
jgi:hypothetical protein